MTSLTIRRLLAVGALHLIGVGVAVAVTAWRMPLEAGGPNPMVVAVARPAKTDEVQRQVNLDIETFTPIWKKRFQGEPVQVPPPPPQPKAEPPKPSLPDAAIEEPKAVTFEAELLGTLVDPDRRLSRAWVKLQDQRRVLLIGDVLNEVPAKPEVVDITPRSLTVRVDSQTLTIEMTQSDWSRKLSAMDRSNI